MNNFISLKYIVAQHCFEIQIPDSYEFQEMMQKSYKPFQVENSDLKPLFVVSVGNQVNTNDIKTTIFEDKRESIENSKMDVFTTSEGWLFEQTQPYSSFSNLRVRFNQDFSKVQIAVRGNDMQRWFAFNNGMKLSYLLATSQFDTVLTHSSCIVHKGKAYLFQGKSGTGKSTHSNLWLKHIPDTFLLNDDNPIIRINEEGTVMAYGSPWSGKTPCYKNISAPIGAIIRIKRALHNSIIQLNPVQAYASLTTSFSGFTAIEKLADSKHKVTAKIIEKIPCFTLSCLPDEEAAQVCHSTVTAQYH